MNEHSHYLQLRVLRVSIATIIAISIPAKESHQMALTVCRTSRNECCSK